ncbi:MAG: hypothetical protein RL154_1617, partial [Pseudomonadota bacterium]
MENREKRTLKKVNIALESSYIADVKSALAELLELYNKQTKRTNKILHTSDKLQESLLILNERLTKINEVQEHNIDNMLQDQKQRARNILYSKKTLYESHKKEVYKYQISINALTDLLAEKDDIYSKYMALKQDYQEAQKAKKPIKIESTNENYSELELENALDKLKENGLEKDLLALTKKIVEEDITVGFTENIQYSKRFLKTFKIELENGFLSSHQCGVQKDKIALFIIRRYLEDMLSIVADIIIQKSVEKVKTAVNFLSSFSGKVVFDSNGVAINKLEIIDNNGNKWVPTAISQVYIQRSSTLRQIQVKKDLIRH